MPDSSRNNNSKMKNIDPRKLAILIELMKEAEGKSMDKLLPLIMTPRGNIGYYRVFHHTH